MVTHEEYPGLPAFTETGALPVLHLKRFWAKSLARKSGKMPGNALMDEWDRDTNLLNTLGLGLEQTIKHLYQESLSFEAFENWILEINHQQLPEHKIAVFNVQLTGITNTEAAAASTLNAAELEFWEKNGYVIVKDAVPKDDCEATVNMICEFLGVQQYNPETWYNAHPARQGIMVQLFQHPLLQKNRDSPAIRGAYEQLWGRNDLYVTIDRVGFNPPETERYPYQGIGLHWDGSLKLPIPFKLQGILYLTDTAANQGAFTLVPGFQHRIAQWLQSLPPGANPRTEDIYALGATPIAAGAGDFIIWQQALPHGASPNTSDKPRFVQYFTYNPVDIGGSGEWI